MWRIGWAPHPWAWPEWEYAGRQRWDDSEGQFRTLYAAESPLGCYLEVLATFRPKPTVVAELDRIREDPEDQATFPSHKPGDVPRSWVNSRLLSSAGVRGVFCDVTAAATIAALRPQFLSLVAELGLDDFDAAAIKGATPRRFTQTIATWLYHQEASPGRLWDGVAFASRHGDDLRMWAIFERPGEDRSSRRLVIENVYEISHEDSSLLAAFDLHGLRWAE